MGLNLYTIIAASVLGVAVVAGMMRRRRKSPEELERERRQRISTIGRITDGTVLDVTEVTETNSHPAQLLIYSYDVAGVSYQAAQDVTHLRQLVDLHTCRLGLPTSVKYDPQNPGNSIVVAEQWTGLRS